VNVKNATIEDWNKFLDKYPTATFFQTYTWTEVITKTFHNCHSFPLLFKFEENREIFLPGIKQMKFGKKYFTYHSMPLGSYGGPLPMPNKSESCLILNYLKDIGALKVALNLNPTLTLDFPIGYTELHTDTRMLYLDTDFDLIFNEKFEGRARTAYRKAVKSFIIVEKLDELSKVEKYYLLYTKSKVFKNARIKYNIEFFQNLFQIAKDNSEFWIANYRGSIIAGAIFLKYGNMLFYWHAFTLEDFRSLSPQLAIIVNIIKAACQTGIKYVNLGGSGNNKGIDKFKASLGAERSESQTLLWESTIASIKDKIFGVI